MKKRYYIRTSPQFILKVLYALTVVFLMTIFTDGTRRVVVYLPAKKIKHFHHHHHHMMLVDPESRMMMPFTHMVHPHASPHVAQLQGGHPDDHKTLLHPHVYKATPSAQNRDFQQQTLQMSRLLAHRPRNLYQPYFIPELSSLVPARPRRYNFEPIATGPAGDSSSNFKHKGA